MTRVVIDASVTLAWCFEDEQEAYANKVGKKITELELVTASVWPLELANALLIAERRRRVGAAGIANIRSLLLGLDVEVASADLRRSLNEIVNLGRLYSLTAYDAEYLDVAMQQSLPIATLDSELRAASAAAGVALFTP